MKAKGLLIIVISAVVASVLIGSIALAQSQTAEDKNMARNIREIKESLLKIQERLVALEAGQKDIIEQVQNVKIWVRKSG